MGPPTITGDNGCDIGGGCEGVGGCDPKSCKVLILLGGGSIEFEGGKCTFEIVLGGNTDWSGVANGLLGYISWPAVFGSLGSCWPSGWSSEPNAPPGGGAGAENSPDGALVIGRFGGTVVCGKNGPVAGSGESIPLGRGSAVPGSMGGLVGCVRGSWPPTTLGSHVLLMLCGLFVDTGMGCGDGILKANPVELLPRGRSMPGGSANSAASAWLAETTAAQSGVL